MESFDRRVASGNLVDAGAAAFLDGHPADGRLGRQLLFGWELLLQDLQDRVHFQVHLVDLSGETKHRQVSFSPKPAD